MDGRRTARWARAASVVAVSIGLLTGCSTAGGAAGAGGSGGGFHLAQVVGAPYSKVRTLTVGHVDSPPANGYEWTVAAVDPSARDLRLSYFDGACTSADHVTVQETAMTVVIGISTSETFSGNCVSSATPRATTVTLRKPLGVRALLEGATGMSDGRADVADPSTLPSPTCSTTSGAGSDVPVGMLDVATRVAPTTATTAFVCRTWWPDGRSRTASTTVTDRAEVVAVARALNRRTTDVVAGPAAIVPCPKRLPGSWYDITFMGPHVQVHVKVDEINCMTIANGGLSGRITAGLANTLDALAPS